MCPDPQSRSNSPTPSQPQRPAKVAGAPSASYESQRLHDLLENAPWQPYNEQTKARLKRVFADPDCAKHSLLLVMDAKGLHGDGSGKTTKVHDRYYILVGAEDGKRLHVFIQQDFTITDKHGTPYQRKPYHFERYLGLRRDDPNDLLIGYEMQFSYSFRSFNAATGGNREAKPKADSA